MSLRKHLSPRLVQGFSTQLHRATEAPHTRELSRLLLEGAPVDGEDEEGCTALHCAAAAGTSCTWCG